MQNSQLTDKVGRVFIRKNTSNRGPKEEICLSVSRDEEYVLHFQSENIFTKEVTRGYTGKKVLCKGNIIDGRIFISKFFKTLI